MSHNNIKLTSLLKEVEDSNADFEKAFLDFAKVFDNQVDTVVSDDTVNEAGVVTALGLVLSVPALMKILGYGLKLGHKVVAKLKGEKVDPHTLGDKIIHAADHIHHKFIGVVEFALKPFIKDVAIRKKAADYIFHAIVLLLLVDSGVGIYKGIKAASIDLKTLSFLGGKAGIKTGELGARVAESELLPGIVNGLIELFKGTK
jgi:hypothetical protein